MTTLVPYQRGGLKRADRKRGAINILQFAVDGVAADVRVDRVDRRTRSSWYALRLAATDSDVTGRLVGVLRGGDVVELGTLDVAPGSIGSTRFAVPPPHRAPYESMFLEIRSEGVLLRVEAPQPPRPRKVSPLAVGAACVALGGAVGCGALLAFAAPRAPLFDPPATAIAGARVRIPYAARGAGELAYSATTDSGTVVAAGPLRSREGDIAFSVPAAAVARRVSITLSQRGPLGNVARSASFAIVAPDPAGRGAFARVVTFAARRDDADSETVLASYLAVGDGGAVELLDHAGKAIASAPFTHRGTTRLRVPASARTLPLIAQLTVHRAGTDAVASVALPPNVVPPRATLAAAQPATATANDQIPEGVTPVDSASAPTGDRLIAAEGRPLAGHALRLRVTPNAAAMHLELQDDTGATLSESTIAVGATTTTLELPAAGSPQKYFLVLHYARNGGEETIVRSLTVAPPRGAGPAKAAQE